MKCSRETLQNLPYFWNTKTYAVFSFCATLVFTGKNKVARNEKTTKNSVGFCSPKIWQILKCFAGTFHQA